MSSSLILMCPRCIIDALSKNIRHSSCCMRCCQILAKNIPFGPFQTVQACSTHPFTIAPSGRFQSFSSRLLFQNLQYCDCYYCYYPSGPVCKNDLECSLSHCQVDVLHRIKSIQEVKINIV